MKRNTFYLLATALFVVAIGACSKDGGDAKTVPGKGSSCQYSSIYNADFARINSNTTYNDLFKLFLSPGDNYENQATNYDTISNYKWYSCNDSVYYIEVDLEGGLPRRALKTVSDTLCSGNVNAASYDSLGMGMSLAQVQATLMGAGDNFENDYEIPGNYLKTSCYRFTSCADTAVHIEVSISPVSGLTAVTRSF